MTSALDRAIKVFPFIFGVAWLIANNVAPFTSIIIENWQRGIIALTHVNRGRSKVKPPVSRGC